MIADEIRRKLFHMSLAIFPLVYMWLPKKKMAVVMAGLTAVEWILEMVRLNIASINQMWMKWFESVYREKEINRFTGLFYAMLAFTVCVVTMNKEVAISSMLFLTFGDAASAFARLDGDRKKHVKGWMSTGACFLVCLGVGMMLLPLEVTLVGAAVASGVERASGDIVDDNLVLPLGSGLAMTLMMGG